MRTYYWPCRITCDGTGQWIVRAFQIQDCQGTGETLSEAVEAARAKLARHLDGQFLIPPLEMLDPEDIRLGKVMRVEINVED